MRSTWLPRCLVAAALAGCIPAVAERVCAQSRELLLFEEVPSVLTAVQKDRVPASVTVINEDAIQCTPARSIYDLIAVYVPGAFTLTHHEGPHIAMRGISSDRNYKFILLLNGRRINQDAHSGGILGLENWDVNDIQRIEIVRGPGSVTYGPGAVEAVINIITKSVATAPGWRVGTQYVHPYDAKLFDVGYGRAGERLKLYLFGSIARTSGLSPDEFFVNSGNQAGYVGHGVLSGLRPGFYLNDARHRPQAKFDLQLDWKDEWQTFGHFSNSGTSANAFAPQTLLPDGRYRNIKENMDQGALFLVRNQHRFSPALQLKSTLSCSSLDHARYQFAVSGGGSLSPDSLKNVAHKFSETEVMATLVADYTVAETYQFAVGTEYSEKRFGPGWGDSADRLRMGDSSNIFGSAAGVAAAGTPRPYYVAKNGWKTHTASLLAEAHLAFDPRLDFIASGRLDRHQWITKPFLSPRVGLISDYGAWGMAKLIWQQSVRMNTEEQMFLSQLTNEGNALEKLDGWELIYNVEPVRSFTVNTSVYYNRLDIVGWSTQAVTADGFSFGRSTVLGKLRLWGLELEEKVVAGPLTVGANQSYCKQIDFHLAAGQTNTGISYSDYNFSVSGEKLTGTGNDLNNWYNWAAKVFTDWTIAPKHAVHLDARVFWGYQGAKDGLTMLENGARGTAHEAAVHGAVQAIRDAGGLSSDARMDASYRYAIRDNASVTVFGMNLVNFSDNKIHEYDSGALKAGPTKVAWIEEPLTVGAKISVTY